MAGFLHREKVIRYHKRRCAAWGMRLVRVPQRLRSNRRIVMAALEEDGVALRFAAERLRDDMFLVLLAIERHTYALEYASTRLRNNRIVVTSAVTKNPYAIEASGQELLADEGFMVGPKRLFRLLKFRQASGASIIMPCRAENEDIYSMNLIVDFILKEFNKDGMEVATSIVFGDVVLDPALALPWWPGLQEPGRVSEYSVIFQPRMSQCAKRSALMHLLSRVTPASYVNDVPHHSYGQAAAEAAQLRWLAPSCNGREADLGRTCIKVAMEEKQLLEELASKWIKLLR
eukprot:6492083-Amphidinium_carterae.1